LAADILAEPGNPCTRAGFTRRQQLHAPRDITHEIEGRTPIFADIPSRMLPGHFLRPGEPVVLPAMSNLRFHSIV